VVRMDAYDRAVRALVKPGDVVLDLGTGTGILAMLAARRGATVHAVESAAVADLAERLFAENGLSDRITLHRGDIRKLEVAAQVDVVISDFMGRFVVDDGMLEAVAACEPWMAPGARFAPSHIAMQMAPVGDLKLPTVDFYERPLQGLSLRAAAGASLQTLYFGHLGPTQMMATAQAAWTIMPPDPPLPFGGRVEFRLERAGRLQAIAGFWTAQLAPDVSLSTAPGPVTHWGQQLFPVPAFDGLEGDRVLYNMSLDLDGDVPAWRWQGRVLRGDDELLSWKGRSDRQYLGSAPLGEQVWRADREGALQATDAGATHFASGELAAAVTGWEQAVAALGPGDDDLAPTMWENLGVGYMHAGEYDRAAAAFMRALDGDTSLEPALRHLCTVLHWSGRALDAVDWIRRYEAAYGAHPDGLKLS